MLNLFKKINNLINNLLFSKIQFKNQQKIVAIKLIIKKKNRSYFNLNILLKNCLTSDWTSLSVICFGVCELSIRCAFAQYPYLSFDQDWKLNKKKLQVKKLGLSILIFKLDKYINI